MLFDFFQPQQHHLSRRLPNTTYAAKPTRQTISGLGFPSTINRQQTSALPLLLLVDTKGAEASWDDAVLSFSVTEQALTSEGVLIELCVGGGREQDPVASGTIPGNVTIQLICRLRSKLFERRRRSFDERISEGADSAPAAASGGESLAVEVRLFAKDADKDAGVCSLNLNFRPDDGNETANEIEGPSPRQAEAQTGADAPIVTSETVMMATSAQEGGGFQGTGTRQSSLLLLEETARHIETIQEVHKVISRQLAA